MIKPTALLLSALALAMIPGTAFAAGFDGPYVAADAGLGIVSADYNTLSGPSHDNSHSAVLRGVVGYRMPVGGEGGLVVGVEGDAGIYTNGSNGRYDISAIGGLRTGPGSMIYTRVGYGWLDGVSHPGGTGIHGLVLGGGFETALMGNTHLRIDYRHIGYSDYNVPDNSAHFTGNELTAGVVLGF
jgi:hypothetical protein